MKEIALTGSNCRVMADVLSALLSRGLSVNAILTDPERMMVENTALTVSRLDIENVHTLAEQLSGYHDAVFTFNDDETNVADNDFALKYYNKMVTAAIQAGVNRLIVVGSPQSQAYFTGDLKRHNGIDWVFISTENDFPRRAASEVESPRFHREVYHE